MILNEHGTVTPYGVVYDLYGEENPRPLADYIARHGQEMGGQQM